MLKVARTHICPNCGNTFSSHAHNAEYCSVTCRKTARKDRTAEYRARRYRQLKRLRKACYHEEAPDLGVIVDIKLACNRFFEKRNRKPPSVSCELLDQSVERFETSRGIEIPVAHFD